MEPKEKITTNDRNWPKTLESLVLWISAHEGVTKPPLDYCLKTEHLAPPAPDLPYGHVDSQYTSHLEEMLRFLSAQILTQITPRYGN